MNAERFLLVSAFLLTFGARADSQTAVGAFGGANFGQLHEEEPGSTGSSYTTRAFAGVGAVVDVGLGRHVSLRAEPMFLGKGSNFAIEPDDWLFENGLSGSLRLEYLELPLLVVLSKAGTGLRPYVMAGPTFGYLLGAEFRAAGQEVDVTDSLNRGDLAVTVGGGLRFPAGPASVFVEARYSQGLWALARDSWGDDPNPKNRGLLVGAGVTFPTGVQAPDTGTVLPSAPERDGFWMGFGLGYGFAKVTCQPSPRSCDEDDTAQGAMGLLEFGWTLNPKLLVGADLRFWSGHADSWPEAPNFILEHGATLGSVSIAGYFYPIRTHGLFVKGGVGLAVHAPSREGIPASQGWSVSAGLGYDFRVARGISVTPVAGVLYGSVGDVARFRADEVPDNLPPELAALTQAHGVKQTIFELGLRITVH